MGGFFGRIIWEEFFGRNYLVEIIKELMFLSRFCLNAQGRKDKYLVRGKLIALKKSHVFARAPEVDLRVLFFFSSKYIS